jgi:transposase
METYVGLDVSQKTTMVCVVDKEGEIVWRGSSPTCPEAIAKTVRLHASGLLRVGMETGPLAVWLYHSLRELGLPLDCIDARHAHAALSVQINKTDANDAHGIAQLTRSGWYRPVQIKSMASHEVRLLLFARNRLTGMRTRLYNQIRGTLKTFGVVLQAGKGSTFEQLVEQQLPQSVLVRGVVTLLLETWRQVSMQIRKLESAVRRLARSSDVCRRLMTVPGVGANTAVAFAAAIDDPGRFQSISKVGPYLGLTPRKYQSGETDHNGRISKRGCIITRHLLFEAASTLILRVKRDCALRRWALSMIPRIGLRKATVAVARKLATLLLVLWRDGKDFNPA